MLIYLLNFILILLSIILFSLPFLIYFKIKNRDEKVLNLNIFLENFFSSNQANWLIFFWALSEAVIWFVIPEFLLLLVIFMRVQRKRQMLYYDIAGTVAGTIIALMVRLPDDKISMLPYIQDKMVAQTRIWYDDLGILGLIHQPFSGVPYKVFTHLAWQYDFLFIFFVLVAVTVRLFRYLVAYGLFVALYPKLHSIVKQNYIPLCLISIFIFSILLLRTYNVYS